MTMTDSIPYLSEETLAGLGIATFDVIESIEALIRGGAEDTVWSAPKAVIIPSDGRYMMDNNYRYSLAVMRACLDQGVQFLYASSAATSGASETFREEPEFERPLNVYGYSKLLFDQVVRRVMPTALSQIVGFRYFNVYGPNQRYDAYGNVIPIFTNRLLNGLPIIIFGDGEQTRSFLYVDECLEGIRRLMKSDYMGPVNIGSEEMLSINKLAEMTMDIAGKKLSINHIPGPLGVRGRNSDNRLIKEKLNWEPNWPLLKGIQITYKWISDQLEK